MTKLTITTEEDRQLTEQNIETLRNEFANVLDTLDFTLKELTVEQDIRFGTAERISY